MPEGIFAEGIEAMRSDPQRREARLQRVSLYIALCHLIGCEVWLDVEAPQCDTNQYCVGLLGRGFTCNEAGICIPPRTSGAAGVGVTGSGSEMKPQLPARWACATDKRGDFVANPDKTVTVRMDAVDLNTLRVPDGLVATACAPADFGCDAPVIESARPGSDGFFEFNLPYGWEGYLTFNAPNVVPGLLVNNRPFLDSQTTSGPALLTVKAEKDLADHAGRPLVPGTGVAIFEVRDCNDSPGDGVTFDLVGDQGPFYFDGALPARSLKATIISNLLAAGREARAVAGFDNIPPSYTTFHARLASSGDEIASITIPIRADTITYVRLSAGY
jgi:hypothetical protein